ncbi:2-keto-4-pentenoate hydratase [Brevundimonas nasdae]|uniref:2-keto-4-pentenoate hydratase n=1 Tax=Brevundimonas nasdae TaxID=172043 RepID=UPI00289C42C3|nr:fumarylacetoacetate hydrolase family protein [Brevundimonas nasdae]
MNGFTSGEDALHRVIMQELRTARATCRPVPSLSARLSNDLARGYRIQGLLIDAAEQSGACRVGWKIGLTSAAARAKAGALEPFHGVLLDHMVVSDTGGELDLDGMIAPRVEVEIAARIAVDVVGPVSHADMLGNIDGWAVAAEVVDTAITDWAITPVDMAADNGCVAYAVVGEFQVGCPTPQSVTSAFILRDGLQIAAASFAHPPMNEIAENLAWLANAARKSGRHLRQGDIVLTGALAPMTELRRGRHEVQVPGFASVEFEVITGEANA